MRRLCFALLVFFLCALNVSAQISGEGIDPVSIVKISDNGKQSKFVFVYQYNPYTPNTFNSKSPKIPSHSIVLNQPPVMKQPDMVYDTLTVDNEMIAAGGNVVVVWPHGAHIIFKDLYLLNSNDPVELKFINWDNFPPRSPYNPIPHLFKVAPSGDATNASIYDINGNKITSLDVDENGNINTDNLKPGIYYIIVTLKNGKTITIKFVKQR